DRNHTWLPLRVVHRGADRVDKPFVSVVWREIDSDVRIGYHRPRHFDVQHHLAVGGIRGSWVVTRMIHRDRRDFWGGNPDLSEKRLQIAAAEATAEFDDCDSLSSAVQRCAGEFGGEVVS